MTLLTAAPEVLRSLNSKTGKSTRFAVIVLRDEDKPAAREYFNTPLLFSIQEAKGLEYESIILFNFVSGNGRQFQEIVEDVTRDQLLQDELKYARARDKSDKSAEAYKFFINAFYVAVTRAVRNLYIVERDHRHRMIELLKLKGASEQVRLARQESSKEDWEREARRLELQGKQEQAELIRKDLLGTSLSHGRCSQRKTWMRSKGSSQPGALQQAGKNQLFEYAMVYSVKPLFLELARLKYHRAVLPGKEERDAVARKYRQDYHERSYRT